MSLAFALTLPALVCLLALVVALERFELWARRASRLPWRPPGLRVDLDRGEVRSSPAPDR